MPPVDVGEAPGSFHALQWLQDIRMDKIDFLVDSKTTTNIFHSAWLNIIEFGQTITSCKSLFLSHFVNSRVEFNGDKLM